MLGEEKGPRGERPEAALGNLETGVDTLSTWAGILGVSITLKGLNSKIQGWGLKGDLKGAVTISALSLKLGFDLSR